MAHLLLCNQPLSGIASVHVFSNLHFLPRFLQLTVDMHTRWPCTVQQQTAESVSLQITGVGSVPACH